MLHTQGRDLLELVGQRRERPAFLELVDGAQLLLGGPARANEVRVVGVRKPVRGGAGRADHRLLVDGQGGVARSGQGEHVGDRLRPVRERHRARAPLSRAEDDVVLRSDPNEELRPVGLRKPHLELGRPRAADRPGAEQRTARVGRTAAGTPDDPRRRSGQRAAAAPDDAGLTENLHRARAAENVQLVARRTVERALPVRPDLALDPEVAQERERSAGHRGRRDVEMERELAVPAEVEAAGRVEQRRDLRERVATPGGRNRRKLVPHVLGKRHAVAPSSASRRRL